MSDCDGDRPETWYKGRRNQTTAIPQDSIADKLFRMTVWLMKNGVQDVKVTISGDDVTPNTEANSLLFTAPASATADADWTKAKFTVDDVTDANNPIYKGGGDLILLIV